MKPTLRTVGLFYPFINLLHRLSQLGLDKIKDKNLAIHILITNYVTLTLIPVSVVGIVNGASLGLVFQLRYVILVVFLVLVLWLNRQGYFRFSRHFFFVACLSLVFFYPIAIHEVHVTHFVWFPYGLSLMSITVLLVFDWDSERIDLIGWYCIFFVLITSLDMVMVENMTPKIHYDLKHIYTINNKVTHLAIWFCTNLMVYYLKYLTVQKEKQLLLLNEKLENNLKLVLAQSEEIASQNEELVQSQEEVALQRNTIAKQKDWIEEKNERLAKFNQALLRLNREQIIQSGNWKEALEYITQNASQLSEVSRVSVWFFDKDYEQLECFKLYNDLSKTFSNGQIIYRKDHSIYFKEALRARTIVASDAQQHPALQEFKEDYLKAYQICSMLDAPFFIDGGIAGVVCLEQQLMHKEWSQEMISFAQTLGDIVTIAYKAYLLKRERHTIEQQKKAMELQNEALKDKQAEIEEINADLEQRVAERTYDLELQNEKLAEYAFINAHLLRGPLCRVKGVANLLQMEEMKKDFEMLLGKMQIAVNELDEVVGKINQTLEEDDHLVNKDLRKLRENVRVKSFL